MSYTVEFLPSAAKELASFPRDVQKRIANKIDSLRENPRPSGVKLLEAKQRLFRLRVGDYRVIYTIEGKRLLVVVVKVGHRKGVYRDL